MREIKFRAWEPEDNAWVFFTLNDLTQAIAWGDTSALPIGDKNLEKVCQYTGLKDKNGVEIFEGDLLKHFPDGKEPYEVLEVFWDNKLNGFSSHSTDAQHLYQTPIDEVRYFVCGNIYENPELLRGARV